MFHVCQRIQRRIVSNARDSLPRKGMCLIIVVRFKVAAAKPCQKLKNRIFLLGLRFDTFVCIVGQTAVAAKSASEDFRAQIHSIARAVVV